MFYDPHDQKVFVSTNVRFLKEDYMINNKPMSKTVLEEQRGEGDTSLVPETQVNPSQVACTQDQGEPHRSGRVVHQLEHFIGLGEVPEDPKMDPNNYNEVVQDKDVILCQKDGY